MDIYSDDEFPDDPIQEPNSIGVEGSMRYLGDLGVKLDEAVLLAVLTELSAPTMGELTREGFVEGWKTYQYVFFFLQNCYILKIHPPLAPIHYQNNKP